MASPCVVMINTMPVNVFLLGLFKGRKCNRAFELDDINMGEVINIMFMTNILYFLEPGYVGATEFCEKQGENICCIVLNFAAVN